MTSFRIHGAVLPAGDVAEVFVDDARISFVPREDAVTLIEDAYLVPGLVDVHAHLALNSPASDGTSRDAVLASSQAHLDAGVLLVREPGGPDHASLGVGPEIGLPRTITGGRFLAPRDGYFPGLAREVSPDELPDAALEEFGVSGAWAKVIGDSPFPGPGMSETFRSEVMAEAARRVHEAGGRIAVHATLPHVVAACVEAGFDSIEHGTLLDPDILPAMAERGVAWVPTLSIDEAVDMFLEQLPPEQRHSALDAHARQPESLRRAVDLGVTILAGTDAGMGPHGMIREEIRRLRATGIPPDVALGAGSWVARRWLGLPGIEEGAPADLVAFRSDPREDRSGFVDPAVVMLDGRVMKAPTV
jgi:imidazolonepropionase-like amidohydrolase